VDEQPDDDRRDAGCLQVGERHIEAEPKRRAGGGEQKQPDRVANNARVHRTPSNVKVHYIY
jgi:hypothetical protein